MTAPATETLLDALVHALQQAAAYNRDDQVAPAAVLWTDGAREWEALLPAVRERLPALLTLGPFAPDQRTGPAYWLRCVLSGALPEVSLPSDATPIVYLPGVSRQELRAVEECRRELQPLVALPYTATLWTQRSGRDWTVAAFLQSADGGLGIDIAGDQATRQALRRALPLVAGQPLATLRAAAPLKAAFFDDLLHPDEVRSVLRWLNNPAGFQAACSPEAWESFCHLCRREYRFDPVADGALSAARKLGEGQGVWAMPWQRLAETPATYLGVATQLRAARPPGTTRPSKPGQVSMFDRLEAWPQDNEAAEADLRAALTALGQEHAAEARAAIAGLESEHGPRRTWPWATLGWAPLATALQALATLAAQTAQPLGGVTVVEIATAYVSGAWQADAAVLDALAAVEQAADVAAVRAAIRAVYLPWLDAAARAMQRTVADALPTPATPFPAAAGTCLLFSDGLRYDVAKRLEAGLVRRGLTCDLDWRLAALPTVTATAKPAIAPVAAALAAGTGFDAAVAATGTRVTAPVLHRLLGEAGIQVLRGDETGDPSGRGWTELGDIDAYCHEHGWKVARQIVPEVSALAARVAALLTAGWTRVIVLTDHGWLLLPGGLPKVELPEHLTELRKGRCARLRPAAQAELPTVPWRWDPSVRIAVAPGIACFEAGRDAEHGGVSPQECFVPVLTVSSGRAAGPAVQIESVAWRGLVCRLRLVGAAGMQADLRTRAADASTSITTAPKAVGADGAVSLPVPDDDRVGDAAFVVVLAADGGIAAQLLTTVGG